MVAACEGSLAEPAAVAAEAGLEAGVEGVLEADPTPAAGRPRRRRRSISLSMPVTRHASCTQNFSAVGP